MIVYVIGGEHPIIVRAAADMPSPETIRALLVFSPDPGRPSPYDLCSWGQLRRALRRAYVRAEADRLWAVETHQGLHRAGFSFSDDAAWQREVARRPTARARRAGPIAGSLHRHPQSRPLTIS